MPAIMTHDFFGKDLYRLMHESLGKGADEREAFLLGNQGPDPLFFSRLSPQLIPYYRLGSTMHNVKPTELILALKDSLSNLTEGEYSVGSAYAAGFMCHYLLDRAMHPLVFFNQYLICNAGIEGLDSSADKEIHGTLEGEYDEMVLYQKRQQTIATYSPAKEILKASNAVLATISKMYVCMSLKVYQLAIPHNMFTLSTKVFRLSQKAFYSPRGIKRSALSRAEELFRPHSFYRTMSHRDIELENTPFDNHEHELWEDPFTGEVHTTSFWDIYDRTLLEARQKIESFSIAEATLENARMITRDINFSGKPTI